MSLLCDKLHQPNFRRFRQLHMINGGSQSEQVGEVETAILDAELFVKYRSPERAIERLRTALERHSRSIALRARLRKITASTGQASEAARQCLALANLYIEREDLNTAHDRLL